MLIVTTGGSTLRPGIADAVAIALTREHDYLHFPRSAGRSRGTELDKAGDMRPLAGRPSSGFPAGAGL